MTPGDILFVIQEQPHRTFKRVNKHNLSYTANISLKHALLGTKLDIVMLNGKTETINIPHVIEPNFVKTVRGLGMPITGYPGSYGDLLIHFNILFPRELSEHKKKEVETVFEGVEFQKSGPGIMDAIAEKFRFGFATFKPLLQSLLVFLFCIWMMSRR